MSLKTETGKAMKNNAAEAEAELDITCGLWTCRLSRAPDQKKRTSEAIFNHTKSLKCT